MIAKLKSLASLLVARKPRLPRIPMPHYQGMPEFTATELAEYHARMAPLRARRRTVRLTDRPQTPVASACPRRAGATGTHRDHPNAPGVRVDATPLPPLVGVAARGRTGTGGSQPPPPPPVPVRVMWGLHALPKKIARWRRRRTTRQIWRREGRRPRDPAVMRAERDRQCQVREREEWVRRLAMMIKPGPPVASIPAAEQRGGRGAAGTASSPLAVPAAGHAVIGAAR